MVKYDIKTTVKDGKTKKTKINWQPTKQFEFDNLIIDESVLIKNRKAQRSKAVYTLANKLTAVKHVYLLSGSPITKFLDDMWHQFHVIDRKRFPSYWNFAKDYCVLEETYWGVKFIANKDGAAQRIKQEYRDIYFARTQDQVLDLPDWIFDTFEIPMDAEQARMYREMQEDFVATLPDGDNIVAPNILSQMTRLIQFASNPALVGGPNLHPKWTTVVDLLEFETLPAIVWTNFVNTAKALSEMLLRKKYRVGLLIGETSSAARDRIVQEFQAGLIDVIVAHPAVGKFGLTLTAARTAIYVERSYNGDDYYQSLHRVRRFGTTHSPHVIILMSNDPRKIDGKLVENPTIDHVIHEVLGFKRDNSIQITTGLIREVLGV
jgi:SNF2 family DNA or RNA helicase